MENRKNQFDLLIIGAGPGGYVAARKAATLGMKVAVIDRGPLGGTCINRGCIPTKAMLYAATLYRKMKSCEAFGLYAENVGYDIGKIMEYKDASVEQMRSDLEREFARLGITILKGNARVQTGKRVCVEGEDGRKDYYFGKNILIAAGAKARRADIPGADLPGVMTSEELLDSEKRKYKSLVIIGGGVIGLEIAAIFRALGVNVTIIEISDRLLPNMDREFSEFLQEILKERGIRIYKESMMEQISKTEEGLCCKFVHQKETHQVQSEAVLMSVGRIPNTEGLFDAAIPVKLSHGRIVVDEFFRTNIPGIYAVGDVLGGIQLAHVASAEAAYVVEKMNGLKPSVVVSMVPSSLFTPISIVPSCLYTDPEIASVGMTEEQAKEKGVPVRCGTYGMEENGQTIISREAAGFIKVVFARDSDVLLGAQLICPRATDMIGELATALANELTSAQLMYAMRAHPTFNEAISCAVENSRANYHQK